MLVLVQGLQKHSERWLDCQKPHGVMGGGEEQEGGR